MNDESSTQTFFDRMSTDRDVKLNSKPLWAYEQQRRQQVVLDLLQLEADDVILDIGCGNARDIRILAAFGCKSVGVDLSMEMLIAGQNYMLENNLPGASFCQEDATYLPFANESFTKAICSEVIEHVPEWHKLISESYRVLKPGGRLVITTPNWRSFYGLNRLIWELLRKVTVPSSPVHPYDKWKTQREVITALKKAGFSIEAKLGGCYVPGYGWILFPASAQQAIVRGVWRFERRFRRSLSGWGYTLAVAGRKP